MRNISDRSYAISKNLVEAEWATDDNTMWRMRIACWINKATGIHNMQSVSGGIVNILGGGSMDYSE